MSAQAFPGFDNVLNRRVRWMQVLARLRPDVTPEGEADAILAWTVMGLVVGLKKVSESPKKSPLLLPVALVTKVDGNRLE